MNFKVWLERREIDLYHGTTTGKDDKSFKSFKQGIDPTLATGHGQGSGYYTFTDKETAKQHAQSLVGFENRPKTYIQHSGNPMVVNHKAVLNPRDYDLDREIQSEDIVKFMVSNRDLINKSLSTRPVTLSQMSDSVVPETLYAMFPYKNSIGFWLDDLRKPEFNPKTSNWTTIRLNTTDGGEDLNSFMGVLFKQQPEIGKLYKSFIRSIMKQTSRGNASHRAFKYVGSERLQPDRLMVKSNDGWVNKL